MLRATPGCRRISRRRSRVSTIWWTDGGLAPKWRCRSASGGDDEPIGRAEKYRHNLTVVRERE
jgi:hypothetical protein